MFRSTSSTSRGSGAAATMTSPKDLRGKAKSRNWRQNVYFKIKLYSAYTIRLILRPSFPFLKTYRRNSFCRLTHCMCEKRHHTQADRHVHLYKLIVHFKVCLIYNLLLSFTSCFLTLLNLCTELNTMYHIKYKVRCFVLKLLYIVWNVILQSKHVIERTLWKTDNLRIADRKQNTWGSTKLKIPGL